MGVGGRGKGGTCGDLMGRAGGGLGEFFGLGTCYEWRHQVDEACCWPGALRGLRPRTREAACGRPHRTAVFSSQFLVFSGR